jgi:aspartate aminotransferase
LPNLHSIRPRPEPTLISYSYGKVLLSPGQRLGYLAIPPLMPQADRQALRDSIIAAQIAEP